MMVEHAKPGDKVLVRATYVTSRIRGMMANGVRLHGDTSVEWVSVDALTTEAAIRADERRRVERSGYASDEAEWVDIACRCCKSKPLMRTWKFCPTCGSDVRAEREGGAG